MRLEPVSCPRIWKRLVEPYVEEEGCVLRVRSTRQSTASASKTACGDGLFLPTLQQLQSCRRCRQVAETGRNPKPKIKLTSNLHKRPSPTAYLYFPRLAPRLPPSPFSFLLPNPPAAAAEGWRKPPERPKPSPPPPLPATKLLTRGRKPWRELMESVHPSASGSRCRRWWVTACSAGSRTPSRRRAKGTSPTRCSSRRCSSRVTGSPRTSTRYQPSTFSARDLFRLSFLV